MARTTFACAAGHLEDSVSPESVVLRISHQLGNRHCLFIETRSVSEANVEESLSYLSGRDRRRQMGASNQLFLSEQESSLIVLVVGLVCPEALSRAL